MSIFEIPLTPNAQTIRINLNGEYYNLLIVWNDYSKNWNIDISSDAGIKLLCGVPLLSNVDLLEQYGYMNFKGELIAVVDVYSKESENPRYSDLGLTSHLHFITE